MIHINEVTAGNLDGLKIWICDLRYNDYRNKPIRSIKPIEVMIRNNNEAPKVRINYSHSHFVGLNKMGEMIKNKVIKPYDTTGYRSYPGIALNCFQTREECESFYKDQVKISISGLKAHRKDITKTVDDKIKELSKYK